MDSMEMRKTATKHRFPVAAAATVGLLASVPCYAYVDPATGSIILQSLLAGIAVALGAIRFYWAKVKAFFSSSPSSAESEAPVGDDSASEKTKVQTHT